jgi:hypothetical protein
LIVNKANKARFYTTEKGETLDGVYTFDLDDSSGIRNLDAQVIPGTAKP